MINNNSLVLDSSIDIDDEVDSFNNINNNIYSNNNDDDDSFNNVNDSTYSNNDEENEEVF